ncbi:hypothetical protein C7N43_18065 [Sphingobacteriales bacterium UPWRP_1]|nr:hypothetical protein BVG80_03410 [Sphingobacteriales bacterium TSM_CSM]PSJ75613.1 hypothetical protein C7N43_18065 [Sphingobacteriales bacterium UPWRP_1]
MKKFSSEYQPTNRRKPDKLTELLKQMLNEPATINPDVTHCTQIVEKLLEMAKAGNMRAIELIFERIDGKVKQEVENSYSQTLPQVIVIEKPADTLPPVYSESEILEAEAKRQRQSELKN